MTSTKKKDKKRPKISHGAHFIQAQGSARYVIRARSKEEALEIAKERFLADLTRGRESFEKTGLPKRWVALAGFEAQRVKRGQEPSGRDIQLRWRNRPRQRWIQGERG